MKNLLFPIAISFLCITSFSSMAQSGNASAGNKKSGDKHLYIDVHKLEPGKVTFEDVAAAHKKDLAVENKYDVRFLKYWVDEKEGLVYCLSSSPDTTSIIKTHAEAHGLLPSGIYEVTEGQAAMLEGNKKLFLDIHYLGAGKVTAHDVSEAHKKDLAVQDKHNVNFINYWVDEKAGVVMCLSEAQSSNDVIITHQEAHGLIPESVLEVQQGQ